MDAKEHRLYQTDWLEEPVNVLNKEERLIKECGIKQGDLLVLRDKDNVTIYKRNPNFLATL